jgi:hypothetical protein
VNKLSFDLKQALKHEPLPKLRTRYQKSHFALKLAKLLQEHTDPEVQQLALMIHTLLGAPAPKVQAMLEIELAESPKLKLLAMECV